MQMSQSLHAFREFIAHHPETEGEWYKVSNYIAILSVADEPALLALLAKADERKLRCSSFREPDLDGQLTAIAIEPGLATRKLCSGLPLALKSHAPKEASPVSGNAA